MSFNVSFENRVVVVIGGTSGINRGIAETFARLGASVVVASRNQEKVDATVTQLKTLGHSAYGFSADVRDQDAIKNGLQASFDKYGEFDVLVSGAAGNFPAQFNDLSSNGFKAVVDIDLVGTFHVLNAAFPFLKKPGASVINISAPQAFVPMRAQAHVCAAKAGVDMVTKTLALEWGPQGVRVNSVVPGPIDNTEGMRRLAPTEDIRQKIEHSVPLKRMGECEEVGYLCAFLSSHLATYINGAIIPVDGGWSLTNIGLS